MHKLGLYVHKCSQKKKKKKVGPADPSEVTCLEILKIQGRKK